MALRVVAGSLGGRRLEAPPGAGTRPTTDRVREATFNALGSLDLLDGARVLDLYAGSGALGIEALSRGASHATFVERDRGALRVLRANLDALGLGPDRAGVVAADALGFVATAGGHPGAGPWDLVLLDPPYEGAPWAELLAAVAARVAVGGVVVAESDTDVPDHPTLRATRTRRYGSTVVTFLRRNGAPPITEGEQ